MRIALHHVQPPQSARLAQALRFAGHEVTAFEGVHALLVAAGGRTVELVAASAGALFGAFLFALASVKAKGIQLPNCGCFGDAIHFTPAQALMFDLGMAVLCWLAWKSAPAALSLDSWAEGGYTGARK